MKYLRESIIVVAASVLGISSSVAEDKVEDVLGMDIIVCTTARTDDEARALLKGLNFPFRS